MDVEVVAAETSEQEWIISVVSGEQYREVRCTFDDTVAIFGSQDPETILSMPFRRVLIAGK